MSQFSLVTDFFEGMRENFAYIPGLDRFFLDAYKQWGVIMEVWGFEVTLFVDIELRKCTSKSIFLNLFALSVPKFFVFNKWWFETQKNSLIEPSKSYILDHIIEYFIPPFFFSIYTKEWPFQDTYRCSSTTY